MTSAEAIKRAIQAARAGRRVEARNLLLKIVEVDPRCEIAWMWLSGLVDTLEDRIIACENVLTINPDNQKVRSYLAELQKQLQQSTRRNIDEAVGLYHQAKLHADRNEIDDAIRLANRALEKNENLKDAWLLISRISPDIDQQITALQKALKLDRSNSALVANLKDLRYLKTNPIKAAMRLEQLGRFDEALKIYHGVAVKTKDSKQFDTIYRQIIRIEGLQKEQIRFVAPASSITRLTLAWPSLYFSLALIQVGLNPFRHTSFYLWLGLPLVILGGYLLSLAEVRSSHMLWQRVFNEQEDGSPFARLVTAATGWFLIIVPHLLLVIDSLKRLQNFEIPPPPF
jgi:tetratricopeptide (TPR) repeat protein